MIDLALFALLIIGSILYLKSILDSKVEVLQREEDEVFAEILLPLSRLMNILDEDEREGFDDDLLDAMEQGYDYVIIVVRKYAWRKGIKIDPKETEVMYKYIRAEEMTETEKRVFERVESEARNVLIFPGGLVICKPTRDNEM